MIFLIIILAVFSALNMGGASFSAAFAASCGGGVISRKKAAGLFVLFVILGSVSLGQNVSVTLGQGLIAPQFLSEKALLVIFFSAGASMFVANVMKIPQSTSLVTVASIAGVGLALKDLNLATIKYLIPFWIILPMVSYGITLVVGKMIYPPRPKNLWIYERFIHHQSNLKKFILVMSCFCAFAVGSNNVANVVGPLLGFNNFPLPGALAIFAVFYGLGAFVFKAPLETVGTKIVPLGLLTAGIISLVSGVLMILASIFGVPQSFVMLQVGAVFSIASLKNGFQETFDDRTTQKTLMTWTINPVITLLVAWGIAKIII